MCSLVCATASFAALLARRSKQTTLSQRLIKLSGVVEDHFCLRQRTQSSRRFAVRSQVTQHSITHALLRYRPHLLLYLLQHSANFSQPTLYFQQHRIDRREPADCPRHVTLLADLLASVPVHVYEHRGLSGPLSEGYCQRTQQHFIDLRVIDARHFLQQRFRLRPAQTHCHCSRVAEQIRAAVIITRQDSHFVPLWCQPVIPLSLHCRTRRILTHGFGPLLVRRRLGRQLHLLTRQQRGAGSLQVFQQNAPRHAIDYQVMTYHQQPRRLATARVEVHEAHERSFTHVETRLHRSSLCFDRCTLFTGRQCTQIRSGKADGLCGIGVVLIPTC